MTGVEKFIDPVMYSSSTTALYFIATKIAPRLEGER